jgi:hypothetical protein
MATLWVDADYRDVLALLGCPLVCGRSLAAAPDDLSRAGYVLTYLNGRSCLLPRRLVRHPLPRRLDDHAGVVDGNGEIPDGVGELANGGRQAADPADHYVFSAPSLCAG